MELKELAKRLYEVLDGAPDEFIINGEYDYTAEFMELAKEVQKMIIQEKKEQTELINDLLVTGLSDFEPIIPIIEEELKRLQQQLSELK